ncbi:histone deacetylase family protein [Mangrovicoccus algicola]|uniref:Histone deacetylase family protein n=1 Tax=Mangrovicoccus algicola TaxID=2771008 RepID=A0A8J7CMC8_9RHOB|nr:histone deacetylase family protein [Mangrovicoccus algicola]MBE3640246.1 histone deacetylase family protein [Mangrovicoccus algicola]
MKTAYLAHSDGLAHVTPPGHPEQVARLQVIATALSGARQEGLLREEAPEAPDAEIRRCHPQAYLDRIAAAIPQAGWAALDGDTHLSPGSLEAARRGVGGCLRAVDMVLSGEAANAFVAMRPPGHHAEAETPMGFCLFGNAAIAAKYALDHHGLSRVAVVDFDVHHGNGTQALLWDDPRALFVSTHQMPLFPGTGARAECGAHGQVLNLPLPQGSDGMAMRQAVEDAILPALEAHQPELLILSAGFDAHRADPLAGLDWETEDFAWITDRLCAAAGTLCGGRVVSTLEGGYDLAALAASVAAHVDVLMQRSAR